MGGYDPCSISAHVFPRLLFSWFIDGLSGCFFFVRMNTHTHTLPPPHTQVELYNHIEVEEMKKVEREVQVRRAWLTEKLQAQDQLPKSANPAVTIGQIETEKRVR